MIQGWSPTAGTAFFLNNIGWMELVVIGVVAVLLFGRKLPDLGRNLAQTYVQFRRGLRDAGDDIRQAVDTSDASDPETHPAPAPETVTVVLEQVGDRPDDVAAVLVQTLGIASEMASRMASMASVGPTPVGAWPVSRAREIKAALDAAGARASLS